MTTFLTFPPTNAASARAFAKVELLPDNAAVLQHIWVDQSHRGHGLGEHLLADVENKLQALGVTWLYTHPSPGQRVAGTTQIAPIPATGVPLAELIAWCERNGFSRLTDAEIEDIGGLATWRKTI